MNSDEADALCQLSTNVCFASSPRIGTSWSDWEEMIDDLGDQLARRYRNQTPAVLVDGPAPNKHLRSKHCSRHVLS